MRFAYVAAGAVVLGAAVSESRSVPSSPQRTPKASKRQTGQAGLRDIQPLTFGNSAMMKTSKVLPSNIQAQLPDGISELEMGNHISPESSIAPPSTRPLGVTEELEIININPTGVPEYVVMTAPNIQGDMSSSDLLGTPRRYLPSPLTAPSNMLVSAGKAFPEPASQVFESVSSSLPSQIQNGLQGLPVSTDDPMEAILQELKKKTSGQSTPPNPMTLTNGPPPPPLFRKLGDLQVPVNPTTVNALPKKSAMTSADQTAPVDELPMSLNHSALPPQMPAPLSRTTQLITNTNYLNNDASGQSPSSLSSKQITTSPVVNVTMGDSERATLTIPDGAKITSNSSMADSSNGPGSMPMEKPATLSPPPPGTNNTVGDSEQATVANPASANLITASPLVDNVTSSIPSNVTHST